MSEFQLKLNDISPSYYSPIDKSKLPIFSSAMYPNPSLLATFNYYSWDMFFTWTWISFICLFLQLKASRFHLNYVFSNCWLCGMCYFSNISCSFHIDQTILYWICTLPCTFFHLKYLFSNMIIFFRCIIR